MELYRPAHLGLGAGRRAAFWLYAASLLTLIAGTEVPTPLYVRYRAHFDLSATALTLLFATYALALIPSLLVFGRLADRFGRRGVVVLGLLAATAAAVVLAGAGTVGWLFAGRALQGVAVGAATGAATAALVELEPAGDRARAARYAAMAVAGGGAGGPLLGGLLAEYAPAPSALSYLLVAALQLALTAGLLVAGGVVPAVRTARARRPGVPAAIRLPFAQVGLTVFTCWSVGALYTSVVPSYAEALLATDNLALLGAVAFVMLATAAAAQFVFRRMPAHRAQVAGLVLLAAGLVALVVAFPTGSLPWLLASAVTDGAGLGLAFLGAQTQLNHIAPPSRRAELAAAFSVCLYLGVALPVLGVGVLADASSLFTAVLWFAVGTGALGLLTAAWITRTAPARLPTPAPPA
ncbi:MFS transporter [Pseudonocardia acaciae]|uniref:MFS transporter n=1 Tax=Pseudonocardia acaciae TaxID=551276 RepID=UPI0006886FDC|nr:MFS transporter [Pseudonocardia acaciae]